MNNEKNNTFASTLPFINLSWALLGEFAKIPEIQSLIDATKESAKKRSQQEQIKAEREAYKDTLWGEVNSYKNETKLLIFIHNNTPETLKLFNTNFNIKDISDCDIPPYEIATLDESSYFDHRKLGVVNPGNKTFIENFFNYGAGNKQCRFETRMMVKSSFGFLEPTRTPVWEHRAKSIGRDTLVCSSRLRAYKSEAPYSYCLDVHIGEES
ncbi:hypothetical protein [Pseudomonas purpurea]|uniref:hypothetical protein n=1 Tax=Pseudomonas purpurea TaxID=3136737 RepID=UPI003264A211